MIRIQHLPNACTDMLACWIDSNQKEKTTLYVCDNLHIYASNFLLNVPVVGSILLKTDPLFIYSFSASAKDSVSAWLARAVDGPARY